MVLQNLFYDFLMNGILSLPFLIFTFLIGIIVTLIFIVGDNTKKIFVRRICALSMLGVFIFYFTNIYYTLKLESKPSLEYMNSLTSKLSSGEIIALQKITFPISDFENLGFGICERNNYTGETCLNYLKYFEKKVKENINQITKEIDEEWLKNQKIKKNIELLK